MKIICPIQVAVRVTVGMYGPMCPGLCTKSWPGSAAADLTISMLVLPKQWFYHSVHLGLIESHM